MPADNFLFCVFDLHTCVGRAHFSAECNGKGRPLPLGSRGRGTEAPHPLRLSFLDAEPRAVCPRYKQDLV